MDGTDSLHPVHRGRHRGEHRDPLDATLAAIWALGHIAALTLLGITAQHQLGADHQSAAPPARSLPDRESTV